MTREAIGARLRFEVLRRCNFACYYCGVPAAMGVKQLHIDHVVPVDLGGTNDPWNLVSACWDCNAGKTNGMPSEELIRAVRSDYCGYLVSTTRIEAQPCAYCSLPIVRQYDDKDPLTPGQECSICNEVWWKGHDYARGQVD